MIQNIKSHIQVKMTFGMTVDQTMGKQNKKSNDYLPSDIAKSPSTDNAL